MSRPPTVLLGVTGSIAAYKALDLVGRLRRREIRVIAVMTDAACQLVGPASFESLTGNPVATDLFPTNRPQTIEHISLAEAADVVAVVPASANFLAKAAHGIADDLLSTVVLVATAPKLAAPAMNVNMWQNPAVQDNLARLRQRGWHIVEPVEGRLACGAEGKGRLGPVEAIEDAIVSLLSKNSTLKDVHVLIAAGRTEEPLDPVRFLSNRSSGRMGFALARAAKAAGARVTLVAGPADLEPPPVDTLVRVRTAAEMHRAVIDRLPSHRVLIMAAAVADYKPKDASAKKIKRQKTGAILELVANPDIVAEAAARKKKGTVIVGFALETEDVKANALKKLRAKKLDLIVANEAAALGSDTNQGWIISASGRAERIGPMIKDRFAQTIVERLADLLKK